MKITRLVPVFVLAVVMLSGCSGKEPAAQPDEEGISDETLSGNDWMSLLDDGKSVECSILSDGMVVKTYAEGKKYRTETEIDGRKHISVSDGKMLWTWVEGERQGMKMEFSCMDDIRTTISEDAGPAPEYAASPEEVLGDLRGSACSESGPIDSAIPDDIAFTDQCALMKDQLRSLDEMKKNLPTVPDMMNR